MRTAGAGAARGREQRLGRRDGLHLGVLRVVDGTHDAGRQVGFELARLLGGQLDRLDAGGPLRLGEPAQAGPGRLRR